MTSPFAWHPASPVMVTADEALVLAYDSREQGPQWMTPAPSKVLSLTCRGDRVYALCEGGTLLELSSQNGEKCSSQTVEGAREVVLTANATPALVTPVGVVFDATTLQSPNALHVGFSSDGAHALVVKADGSLELFDARSGASLKTLALDRPATGAWWNPEGKCWLVCAGTHVKNVKADLSGVDIFVSFKEPMVTLAVDATGRFVMARAEKTVLLLGFPNREMIGSLSYFDKTPGQLAFGPAPWAGVGLDGGDANSVNLTEEGVYRTDPHAGRVRNRWMLSVNVDPQQTAKVLGAGAAVPVVRAAPPPAPAPVAAPAVTKGRVPVVPIAIGLALLLLIVALMRG